MCTVYNYLIFSIYKAIKYLRESIIYVKSVEKKVRSWFMGLACAMA